MAEQRYQAVQPGQDLLLLYRARNEQELLLRTELEEIAKQLHEERFTF